MLDVGIAPKLPTIFTGRERFRDSSAASGFRTSLGLGTIATQNANNVNISGGSLSGISSMSSSYYYGSYSYISYLYPTVCQGNYLYATTLLDVQAAMQLKPVLHTSNGYISDSETVVLCDASSAATCTGTPSTPSCSSYSTQGGCESNTSHGSQCSWNSVYCPSYNGDQTTCEYYHCTWETTSCSPYNSNQMTCESHSGCTWNTNYGNCSDFNGSESTCNSTSGCTWNYSDCHVNDNTDQATCEANSGCSWDSMGNLCNGQYNTSCSGSYVSGYTCDGTTPTGNCVSSGSEGYCSGTVTCGSIVDSGICSGESGCSWVTGIALIMPPGNDGRTVRIQKVDSSGGVVTLTPCYPSNPQYIRAASSYTLTSQWQDVWLTYYASTQTWS